MEVDKKGIKVRFLTEIRNENLEYCKKILEEIKHMEPSSKITSVLCRLEIARRNIIAASSLLDNENRSPIAENTSISSVHESLNKLMTMLLPHVKFERVDISDTDSPECIFSKEQRVSNIEIYVATVDSQNVQMAKKSGKELNSVMCRVLSPRLKES